MKKIIAFAIVLGTVYYGISVLTESETEPTPSPAQASKEVAATQLPKAPPKQQPSATPLSVQDAIRKLTAAGKWYEALEAIEKQLAQNPKDSWALELGGMIYLSQLDKPEKSLTYFTRYLTENPNSDFVITRIYEIADKTENPELSFNVLKKIDQAYPGHPALELALGDQYAGKGDLTQAKEYYRKSAQSEEQSALAFRRLGKLASQSGDLNEAKSSYQSSITAMEQEREQTQKSNRPTDQIDIRINYTRLELIETLIQQGDTLTAQQQIDQVSQHLPLDHPKLKELIEKLDG